MLCFCMSSKNLFIYLYFSQMFYDEDGDLAQEFYEEVVPRKGHASMRRITKRLSWQVCVWDF